MLTAALAEWKQGGVLVLVCPILNPSGCHDNGIVVLFTFLKETHGFLATLPALGPWRDITAET